MAISLIDLAARLRLGDGVTAPVAPISTVLTALQETATLVVARYAPTAPATIADEAIVRIVGYLYEIPPGNQRNAIQNSMTQSGATGLLDLYRAEKAFVIADDGGEAPAPTGAVTVAQLDAEIAERMAGDGALGLAIANLNVGGEDATARRNAATAQTAADKGITDAATAQTAAGTAQTKANANEGKIGNIPAPLTNVGDWITDLSQAVQLDADEEGTLNSKINKVNNALVDEVTARKTSDVEPAGTIGQIYAKKSGDDFDAEWVDPPSGTGGGGGGGTPFAPSLIFTSDDVDLPNDQTTVAITLTEAWDGFDAFYFSGSLRNADAINNLILKQDFQRVGVKAAAGTNWYSGDEPQAIFVLDQNTASGGVAGIAICRIADTTMLLLARSFTSSSVNAQDIRIWGINFGAGGGVTDAQLKIATDALKEVDRLEAIARDAKDVSLAADIGTEASTRETEDTALTTALAAANVKVTANRVVADAGVLAATANAASVANELTVRERADLALGVRIDAVDVKASSGGGEVRGDLWATITFAAQGTGAVPSANLITTLTAEATAAGLSRVPANNQILLPISPPSPNIIGYVIVASADGGATEVMHRMMLWGHTPRNFPWQAQAVFFSASDEMHVRETRSSSGTLSLTFNMFTGRLAGGVTKETLKIYPALGGGGGGNDVIARETASAALARAQLAHRPGPIRNSFSGTDRAQAIEALEEFEEGVTAVEQSYVFIYDARFQNRIRVEIDVARALGALGNRWKWIWGGTSNMAMPPLVVAVPSREITVKWAAGSTLGQITTFINANASLSAELFGDPAAVASVQATWTRTATGASKDFRGGVDQVTTPEVVWKKAFADNKDFTVTLHYMLNGVPVREIIFWDTTAPADWKTIIILTNPPVAARRMLTALIHANTAPTLNSQWYVAAQLAKDQLIERTGGGIAVNPTVGSTRPRLPGAWQLASFVITDGTHTTEFEIRMRILPSGALYLNEKHFTIGGVDMVLSIADRRIYVNRITVGNTPLGVDIWWE